MLLSDEDDARAAVKISDFGLARQVGRLGVGGGRTARRVHPPPPRAPSTSRHLLGWNRREREEGDLGACRCASSHHSGSLTVEITLSLWRGFFFLRAARRRQAFAGDEAMGFSTRLGTVVYAAPEILDAQARRHRFPSSSSSSAMVPMGLFVLCDVVSSSSF